MRRDWQPGDVALVNDCTNPDAPWMPATCAESAVPGECETVWVLHQSGVRVWGSVSKARPLVVIDPESYGDVHRFAACVEEAKGDGVELGYIIQEGLRRYADPTPPKPDEPTGLGAVVEDAEGADWHRTRDGRWIAEDGLRSRAGSWHHIDAVRVLHPGVTEGDR